MPRSRRLLALALALRAASSAAQTPAPACSLDDVAVPFAAPLTLLHTLPAPSAVAEYPFVEVLRAARVRVDFPVGDRAPLAAYVALETAAVRLRGLAHADAIPLFPARPIRFGGVLIPLAHHGLRLHGASPEGVLITPLPLARVRHHLAPERRPCADLRLRAPAPFTRASLLDGARARRVPTPRGVWTFYAAPDGSGGSRAQVQATPRDAVWLLEAGRASWHRVLWITEAVALLGWTRPPHAQLGFGFGTGSGVVASLPTPRDAVTCPRELTLFADDRGALHEVGAVLAGASLTLGAAAGERTRVTVYDRDLRWADGVAYFVPTAQLAGCASR